MKREDRTMNTETTYTVTIGGGQAGLAISCYLRQAVYVSRIDAWRHRIGLGQLFMGGVI
jgi:hypothetical protein